MAQYLPPAFPRSRFPKGSVNGAVMSDGDTWVVALVLSAMIVFAVAVASRSIVKELKRSA